MASILPCQALDNFHEWSGRLALACDGRQMLSSRIRAARQAAPLTMAALGSKLDPARSRKLIHEWEKGRCEPSLSTIEQLAAALGVSPCWLAFGCEVDHGK